jgi:hypothetical protein
LPAKLLITTLARFTRSFGFNLTKFIKALMVVAFGTGFAEADKVVEDAGTGIVAAAAFAVARVSGAGEVMFFSLVKL